MITKIPADTTEEVNMIELLWSKITSLQKENKSHQTEIAELKKKVKIEEIHISRNAGQQP